MNIFKKINIEYDDLIFYILLVGLFLCFLVPWQQYVSLNLIYDKKANHYVNDLSVNLKLLFTRYTILYYSTSICILLISFNKNIVERIINRFSNHSQIIQIAIILFFILGLISSAFAYSSPVAFKNTFFTLFIFILVYFLADYFCDQQKQIKVLYITVLLSLILYSIMLLLQLTLSNFSVYGAQGADLIQRTLLKYYNTNNPRFLDNYFSWFMPLMLLPWIMNYRMILKTGSFLVLILIWFIVINHSCRAIFLEYIIICLFLLVFDRKLLLTVLKISILTLLIAFIFNYLFTMFVLQGTHSDIVDKNLSRGYDRIFLLKEAFGLGLKHPLLGIGPFQYPMYTKSPAGYPHNIIMEIWSQWGIPAFICFITVLLNCITFAFKNLKTILNTKPYNIFMLMLIAGMIDSMVSAIFRDHLGYFGSIFVFGLCLSFVKVDKSLIDSVKFLLIKINILRLVIYVGLFFVIFAPFIWKSFWL